MRAQACGIVVLCALGLVGCRRTQNSPGLEIPATVRGVANLVGAHTVIVEGCLTSSGDRFVLTQLRPGTPGPRVAAREGVPLAAAPRPTTETYRLVGMHDQLKPLSGQRVQITGPAEPEKVFDIRESSSGTSAPERPAATSGAAGDATVKTQQSAHLEVHDLQVRSVEPTGDRCGEER